MFWVGHCFSPWPALLGISSTHPHITLMHTALWKEPKTPRSPVVKPWWKSPPQKNTFIDSQGKNRKKNSSKCGPLKNSSNSPFKSITHLWFAGMLTRSPVSNFSKNLVETLQLLVFSWRTIRLQPVQLFSIHILIDRAVPESLRSWKNCRNIPGFLANTKQILESATTVYAPMSLKKLYKDPAAKTFIPQSFCHTGSPRVSSACNAEGSKLDLKNVPWCSATPLMLSGKNTPNPTT